ncbi:helix-turn-helix transcriptional regulator [Algoriphagus sp. PAP.12]|uniref:helix-turn-helix transcriptional regulator n=1 Tax=Algoriphagus sp. PAP.12 TaxID=2996678 RepID=UPI00227ACD03|nr:LuxR C-terminal-related transcriptional regulator [Algoriphagus sp. PAP.12]
MRLRLCTLSTFIICTFLFLSESRGQNAFIDSLKNLTADNTISEGQKIEILGEIAKTLSSERKLTESKDYAQQALLLSWKENDKKYLANIHSIYGYIYYRMDSISLAYQSVDSATWYASRTTDKKTKAMVIFRTGWLHFMENDIEKSYDEMLQALQLLDGLEEYDTESNIYHYLSSIYSQWKDPKMQFYYTKLCLETAQKSNDIDAISNANLIMGNSYLNRYRADRETKKYLDSAIIFTQTAYAKSQSKGTSISSTQAAASLNLSNIYLEFFRSDFQDSVIYYAEKAISIAKKIEYTDVIVNGYGIMSEIPSSQGNYSEAEKMLNTALLEVEKSPKKNPILNFRIYNALAGLAEKENNPEKALTYFKKQQGFYREIFDNEKVKSIQSLEAKYQSEKNALALDSAEKEAAFNRTLNMIYILIMILGALVIFFFFRSYRLKLKSSHQKQVILETEKNAAQLRADYKEEERARLQAESELLQERFGRMEKELLAGNLQVEEKNKLVDMLKERLSTHGKNDPLFSQLEKLIAQNAKIDQGYDEIKTEIEEVQPEFVSRLQEKSENNLTRLDLKYCSYILMGLSNKEIANKLNIDPKSIRMAKYRIKQKLKLEKEDDLTQFITELNRNSKG